MRRKGLIGILLLAFAVSACASEGADAPVVPAPDRPTFVYFYTEG